MRSRLAIGVMFLAVGGLMVACGPKDEPPANEERLRQAESRFQTSDGAADTPTRTGQSDSTTSEDQ